ncbi:MAG: CarD family transcriptional regulator [Pseudomonadota bacterium]
MFKVGDIAVYPAHGVGVIESIEDKEISGAENTFYMLRILNNNMRIMIPIKNTDAVGLREVISTEDVPKIYKILKEREVTIELQAWNRRYREYMEKIKTGSVFEVAQVFRDLFLLKMAKDLSYGERRILDMARSLLVKELAIAENAPEERIEQNIKGLFNG